MMTAHEPPTIRDHFRPSLWGNALDGGATELLATLTPHEEALMRENHELRAQHDALIEQLEDLAGDITDALFAYEADLRDGQHHPCLITSDLTAAIQRAMLLRAGLLAVTKQVA